MVDFRQDILDFRQVGLDFQKLGLDFSQGGLDFGKYKNDAKADGCPGPRTKVKAMPSDAIVQKTWSHTKATNALR